MKRIRWGIISTAKIGTAKVIPAMQRGEYCEVAAIASRDIERARQAARQLGIPKAYGSYEDLLDDAEIDAVYNPLPNHLHVPVSIQATQGGQTRVVREAHRTRLPRKRKNSWTQLNSTRD